MIIFTDHAKLKCKQRGIAQSLVTRTLKQPDAQRPSREDRRIAYKKFNKLFLKVVYRREGKDMVVVTQHWDQHFTL